MRKPSLIRRSKGNRAISGGQTRQRRRKLNWSLKSLIFSHEAAGSTSGLVLASPSVSHTTQCVCVCVSKRVCADCLSGRSEQLSPLWVVCTRRDGHTAGGDVRVALGFFFLFSSLRRQTNLSPTVIRSTVCVIGPMSRQTLHTQ